MKKILVLVLVLGISSMASASIIGYNVVPSNPTADGWSPENPLSTSDIVYVDILVYDPNPTNNYIGINSTGEIYLDIAGPGSIGFSGRYGSLLSETGLSTLDSIGVTYYSNFYYAPLIKGVQVEYAGFNIADTGAGAGTHDLMIAGGVPATVIDWGPSGLTITGQVMFDHIPIHCDGDGNVTVSISVQTGAAPFGAPSVANDATGYALEEDTDAQAGASGSLTIYQVPEPMTMALLGIGGLALIRRRRR